MIPKEVCTLFDFIDYLDSNKKEYIEKYIPLCNELNDLYTQRRNLKPNNNYKNKLQYDIVQNQINEKFQPIISNVYNPIINKLKELEIWSGDESFANILNNNNVISNFKQNFSTEDIDIVFQYKQKYLKFRTETNTDFLCMTLLFNSLDEILKNLFDFLKDTNDNEFDSFETKTIKTNSLEELVADFTERKENNVKYSIPMESLYENKNLAHIKTSNVKNEIIMGDKIQVENINNNSGQISIGRENKNEIFNNNQNKQEITGNKNNFWTIAGVVVTIISIVVTIWAIFG